MRWLNRRCQDLGRLGQLKDVTTGKRINCTEPYDCVAQPLYNHTTLFAPFKIDGYYRAQDLASSVNYLPSFGNRQHQIRTQTKAQV